MGQESDFIGLGEAAVLALEAGIGEQSFVDAVNSGVLDTRVVDGLPKVSRHHMEVWCRVNRPLVAPGPGPDLTGTLEGEFPAEWFARGPA